MTVTEICFLAWAMAGIIVVVILLRFGRGHEHRPENRGRFGSPAPDLRSNLDGLRTKTETRSQASARRGGAQMPHV